MVTGSTISFKANPRYNADSLAVHFGSSKDSRIIYDGVNDEWTVQTKDAAGAYQDRLRIEANTNTPDVDMVSNPFKWTAGRAVTAADYAVGRDADATNQLHLNVPTGASVELSINDVAEYVFSATDFNPQGNTLTNLGRVQIGNPVIHDLNTATIAVFNEQGADIDLRVEGDANANLLVVDASEDKVGIGAAPLTSRAGVLHIQGSDTAPAGQIGTLIYVDGTVTADPNQDIYALRMSNSSLVTPASGVANLLALAVFAAPSITITGGGAATNGATIYITGAPTGPTNNYALWVDAGLVRWDDPIALGGGVAPTLGTIGGSGPAVAAQNQWLRVNINGTTMFIPVWA